MEIGATVAGRFLIEALAGSGGIGEVYRAVDGDTGAAVAVKVLRDATPADRARFEHEASALAELRHPAIVRHIAHGYTDLGEPYLAMEWLAGEDLATRLARAPCSVAEALELTRRAAEGLAALHARGMVHRDLKPSNLFLEDGRIDRLKLIDFGLVRTARPRLTLTGALVGTPGYVAPEQAQGASRVGPAADVFSLGCVLFEALAGRQAFAGDDVMALLVKLILDDPPDLAADRPDAPPELVALLRRMLARSPEDRPQDAAAVLLALADVPPPPADAVPPTPRHPEALTGAERRVLSLILIPACTPAGATLGDAHALDLAARLPALAARLKAVADAVDGAVHPLPDGSLVLTIGGMATPKDRAAVAARLALSLRDQVGDRPIVLVTGGAEGGPGGVADTIDRALRRLARVRRLAVAPPAVDPVPTVDPAAGFVLAARPPIAVDDVTAALLAARFDCRDAGDGPELLGERAHTDAARVLLGREVECVGRERDLAGLVATFREAVDECQSHVVVVMGPPGRGKSRLAHEFVRGLRDRGAADVWTAQADPFRTDSSLALLGDAVRGAIGLLGTEPLATRQARLADAVAAEIPAPDRQRVREFLGELVDAPFPDEHSPQLRLARQGAVDMTEQLRHAFVAFLAARCRRAPVVLVLEDLHWGDLLSVRLLDAALRDVDQPFLVLALARPELQGRFPELWSGRRLQHIHLAPLARRAAERLVHAALGPGLDAALCDRLVERADGNAFYLEELIRATATDHHSLPETVVAMAQARLEALPRSLRRALRAASVFGRVFWASGVHALTDHTADARNTRDRLDRLVDDEVITRRRSSRFPGDDELEFRHDLLREGAYAMLTAADRRLGHQLAAAWLERHGEPDARVLAEHCERGDQPRRAVGYYVRAADDAWDNGDGETAAACAARGLDLGAVGQARGSLLAITAAMHARRGDFAASLQASEEVFHLLTPGDRPWLHAFMTTISATLVAHPDRFAERIQRLSPTAAPQLHPEALFSAAWIAPVLAYAGLVAPALELLAHWRRPSALDPDDILSRSFVRGAESALLELGEDTLWRAMLSIREATENFAAMGLRSYQCICGGIYGRLLTDLGDHALAESVLREDLAVALAARDPISIAYARLYLARALATAGTDAQQDEALGLAELAIAANTEASSQGPTVRAESLLRLGQPALAEAEARRGGEQTRPTPGYWWRAVAVHARTLLALDRVPDALAATTGAIDRLLALGMVGGGDIELLHVGAVAHRRAGADDRAIELLRAALGRLRRRLADIPPEHRPRYLHAVPPNARLLRDARAWLGPDEPALTDLGA